MAALGKGARFSALQQALKEKGARDPRVLAATIGMRKFGKARMEKMAEAAKAKKTGK